VKKFLLIPYLPRKKPTIFNLKEVAEPANKSIINKHNKIAIELCFYSAFSYLISIFVFMFSSLYGGEDCVA